MLFIGTKGMILSNYTKHVLLPEKEFKDFKRPEPYMPKSLGHWAEWVYACKTGSPTLSNFEYAGWLTEANHLGNVAYRAGKKLRLGPRPPLRRQRPRGRAVHPARVPQRVVARLRLSRNEFGISRHKTERAP